MIKACIFDLDGTLTNTLDTLAYFVNTEMAKHGIPPAPVEKFKYFAGNGSRTLINRTLEYHGIQDRTLEDTIFKSYTAAYDNDFLYLCTVYSGIPEIIQSLYQNGIKLAVLTNKPHQTAQKVVEAFFGSRLFHTVLGQREGIPVKPDPTSLYELLTLLECTQKECLYIGDTAVDINTGTAGGLVTVGVLWGFRPREELELAHAHYIIEKPAELLPLVNIQ